MPRTTFRLLLAAGILVAPGVAMAHPGHGAELGLSAGLAHPWSGIDHVLAMTAVGLLAARLGGRALWAVPAAFLGLMALGGIATAAGLSLPFAEVAIALAVFGFTIASRIAPPVLAAMALVGVFALFHGHVHAGKMPANASALAYGTGFLASTALLHGLGIGLGLVIGNGDPALQRRAVRISGIAIGLVGTGLVLGAI